MNRPDADRIWRTNAAKGSAELLKALTEKKGGGMKIGAYYRAVRLRKWKEQGGCCRYCGQPTAYFGTKRPKTWPRFPRNEATLDHVIPISLGGARDPQVNCVIACRACNQERGNKDARLFEFEKQGLIPPPAQAAHGMRN